jgi:hypothetical protein
MSRSTASVISLSLFKTKLSFEIDDPVPQEALFYCGTENEGRRPEEIFKFRISEMPFPGLWQYFGEDLTEF